MTPPGRTGGAQPWLWPLPGLRPPAWRQSVTTAEPMLAPGLPPRALRALLPVLLAAIAFRALPDVWQPYPTGIDWGLYLTWAEQYLAAGLLPERLPHYQLGLTRWLFFPGAPLYYALPAQLAGTLPAAALPLTALVGAIEAAGVFLLGWRLFGRRDAALAAALAAAVSPGSVEMAAWGGYGNLLGLALLPFAWVAWLELWAHGGIRRAFGFAVAASAVAVSHHLCAFWLATTLGLFLIPAALRSPALTVDRLRVVVPAVVLLCGPVLAHAVDVGARLGGSAFFFGGVDRFESTRAFVAEVLAGPAGALTIAVLVPGLAALIFLQSVPAAAKDLVVAHLTLAAVLTFAGPLGLRFHHWRAIFFFGLLASLATGALVVVFDRGRLRAFLAVGLLAGFAGVAVSTALRSGEAYRVASPGVTEAVDWLQAHSGTNDIVLTSNWLGFQLLRQLERPLLVAVPPRDLFEVDPHVARLADEALAVLGGEADAGRLRHHGVRFVVVRVGRDDVPSPSRSRAWLDREPTVRRVFANSDTLIYEVLP